MEENLLSDSLGSDMRDEPDEANPIVADDSNKLGLVMGALIPTILSIFGVMLFLRMGWVVGQAGLIEGLGIIVASTIIVTLTTLSLSAISTNGTIRGGGVYYMISRALGPEFGGAIGLIFWLANVSATAVAILGLSDSLISAGGLFYQSLPPSLQLQVPLLENAFFSFLLSFILSFLSLVLVTVIILAGSSLYAKSSLLILIILAFSLSMTYISIFFREAGSAPGFTGLSWDTFVDNLLPHYGPVTGPGAAPGAHYSALTVFGVAFPCVTGINAGANMSGDLKNPAKSIPTGTLTAIVLCVANYFVLMTLLSASVTREALQGDFLIMQTVVFYYWIVSIGLIAVSLSAALSGLIGAAKVFQALGRDDLIPGVKYFSKGFGASGEPRLAVLLSAVFVFAILLVNNLNLVATISSMFFLLSYTFTNFACFALKVSSAPNFRPTFRYFTWHTALAGGSISLGIMVLLSPLGAVAALAFLLVVWLYIHMVQPSRSWGDISQAIIYHQVRKFLLRLDSRKDHVKFWRPQVLLLVHTPRSYASYNMIDFVNSFKKTGLYVLGHAMTGHYSLRRDDFVTQSASWNTLIEAIKVKAFSEITIAPSIRLGLQNLMMTAGLGSMKPNIVVMGFYEPERQPVTAKDLPGFMAGFESPESNAGKYAETKYDRMTPDDYVKCLQDALYMGKNIAIARNFEKFVKYLRNKSHIPGATLVRGKYKHRTIDVYVGSGDIYGLHENAEESVSLCMLLGYLASRVDVWAKTARLRFIGTVFSPDEVEPEMKRLQKMLREVRIAGDVEVVCVVTEHLFTYRSIMSRQLRQLEVQHAADKDSEFSRLVQICKYLLEKNSLAQTRDLWASGPVGAAAGYSALNSQEMTTFCGFMSHLLKDLSLVDRWSIMNEIMGRHSSSAAAILTHIPKPPHTNKEMIFYESAVDDAAVVEDYHSYLHSLDILSRCLPPIIMMHSHAYVLTKDA